MTKASIAIVSISFILRWIGLAYLILWLFVEYKAGRKTRMAFAVFTLLIGYLLASANFEGAFHRSNAVYTTSSSRLIRATLEKLRSGDAKDAQDAAAALAWLDERFKPSWKDGGDYDALVAEAIDRMTHPAASAATGDGN